MKGQFTYRVLAIHAMVCIAVSGCALTDLLDRSIGTTTKSGTGTDGSRERPATAAKTNGEAVARLAAPRPKPKPTGFDIDPKALVNLDEKGVRELMGQPAMVREEPPAVIWSYLRGECRLDVYLYENLNTRVLRSLTYVVETSRRDIAPETHCLRQVN